MRARLCVRVSVCLSVEEEVGNTEELEIEMVTQDEVDWNKAFFSESSDEESQIDNNDPDW